MNKIAVTAFAATAVVLAGCADDPNRSTKTGALIGAVAGAVAGNQVSDARGAPIVGAVVGALAGGAVGNYMDRQRRELEQKLAAERARDELRITQLSGDALKVGVASDVSFEVDKSDLKPNAQTTYAKIANVLKDYDKTVIHVVGHTDSTGSDAYNKALSQRRASSVAQYLIAQGVPADRIRQEGRGESEPIASNDTPEGRRQNRRVDVVIKPVVEGNEQAAYAPPPYLGS